MVLVKSERLSRFCAPFLLIRAFLPLFFIEASFSIASPPRPGASCAVLRAGAGTVWAGLRAAQGRQGEAGVGLGRHRPSWGVLRSPAGGCGDGLGHSNVLQFRLHLCRSDLWSSESAHGAARLSLFRCCTHRCLEVMIPPAKREALLILLRFSRKKRRWNRWQGSMDSPIVDDPRIALRTNRRLRVFFMDDAPPGIARADAQRGARACRDMTHRMFIGAPIMSCPSTTAATAAGRGACRSAHHPPCARN